MKRFILSTYIAVDADTLEQTSELLEQHFRGDLDWVPLGEHMEVFSPNWPPVYVYELELHG